LVGDVFTVGKLLPLVLFVAVGLFFIDPQRYNLEPRPGYGDFTTAVLLLVYAFTGFEIPVIAAGEVGDPRRDFPFALLTGIGVVVLLYVMIQFVCIGTLPDLADSKRPLADAGSRFLGAAGASIISLGAIISTTGTLNVTLLAGSRLPFALAEQGQLPLWLARTHPRFHTPYISILLSSAVILALTLSGTFIYALTLSTIARLFTYASTCLALIVLRRRSDRPAAFIVPGGVFVAVASLGLIAWLLTNIERKEALAVGIAIAAGLLLCGIYARPQR
jgi:amino acid transporter